MGLTKVFIGRHNVFFLAGAAVALAGFILQIVAMTDESWTDIKITIPVIGQFLPSLTLGKMEFGIFRYCIQSICDSTTELERYNRFCPTTESCEVKDKIIATAALATIGAVLGGLSIVIAVCHAALIQGSINASVLPILAVATSFFASISVEAGVIVWGVAVHDVFKVIGETSNGYSFTLSIVGGILLFVASIMFIVGRKNKT